MRKVVVAAVAASVLGLPAGAQAATVTNTADSGPGSLREAIAMTPVGGTVDFQAGVTGTINLQSTLAVGKALTIQGPGARVLSISGQDNGTSGVRVLDINAPGGTVNISGLTLTKGRSVGRAAGISIVAGTVNVSDSAITANVGLDGQFTAFGGGIYVNLQSFLTLTRSLVAANRASAAGPLVDAWGGGVIVFGTATIVDSSIVDNHAEATADPGGTAFAEGGGIFGQNGGVVSVVRSTVARNDAQASGGGAGTFSAGGGMRLLGPGTLAGSVVAENTVSSNVAANGPDCAGQVTVAAPSLIENASGCTISGSGAITGVAPGFAADGLADHGGPTDTLALAAGAQALNQLPTTDPNCTGAITDQRGVTRPQGSACDLGAFEARPPNVVATPSSHDYGSVQVGQTSPAQAFGLTNQGDLPAAGLNPTLTDGTHFTLDNSGCLGFTLNPRAGNSCTVSGAFKPAGAGAHTTMLHIAGGFTGDVATLTGTGTVPPPPPPPPPPPVPPLTVDVSGDRCDPVSAPDVDVTVNRPATGTLIVARQNGVGRVRRCPSPQPRPPFQPTFTQTLTRPVTLTQGSQVITARRLTARARARRPVVRPRRVTFRVRLRPGRNRLRVGRIAGAQLSSGRYEFCVAASASDGSSDRDCHRFWIHDNP